MKIKWIYLLALILSIVVSTSVVSADASKTKLISKPILKINDYYVLHTYPKAPYIDSKHRLMIPLRAISDLLGAKVSFDPKAKTATIVLSQKSLVVTLEQQKVVYTDGVYQMDTIPVMYQGSMFIPLRVLIDVFELDVKPENNVVMIQSSAALSTGMFQFFLDDDRFGIARTNNPNALQPLLFTLDPATPKGNGYFSYNARILVKNISDKDITKEEEDFHTWFLFEGSMVSNDNDGPLTDVKDRRRYAVEKDSTFTFKRDAFGSSKLLYVLAAGRTLFPRNKQ